MTISKYKNPLSRSGTSQQQRQRQALAKDYVHVDERTPADLLIFARRLAGQLKFYDLENKLNGDWSGFFTNDVSFLIAILANNDTKVFKEKWDGLVKQLKQELDDLFIQVDGGGDLLAAVKNDLPSFIPTYKVLHDFLWSMASQLDNQTERLPGEAGLKDFAKATIRKDCSPAFKKLLGLYKAGINQGGTAYFLIDEALRQPFGVVADLRQYFTQDILTFGLSPEWLPTTKEWQDYFDNDIQATDYSAAFGQNVPAALQRPEHVGQYLLPSLLPMESVFETLVNVFEKITAEAPVYLERTLEEWPNHEPHIALYLAFVKLFRFAQDHINGLKERHLDYYFKDVLRLKEKPAQPDEAHLILTLAKHVGDHLLAQGTAFKAGKDSEKKEVSYEAVGNTELNKAEVVHLQAIYHSAVDGKFYTAPIANSLDGLGEALTAENAQWKPFGPVTQFLNESGKPVAPTEDDLAKEVFDKTAKPNYIGFAVASPNLFLKEGTRTVTLEFSLKTTPAGFNGKSWNKGLFTLHLTGEKGWVETQPNENPIITGGKLKIKCQLGSEVPSILPYNAKTHGGNFNTQLPLLLVRIGENATGNSPYTDLRKLKITGVTTTVDVTGVKDLLLQNELGRLDSAKPFQPFGGTPKTNDAFLIGSKEVFQKKLTGNLNLSFEWDGGQSNGLVYKTGSAVNCTVLNLVAAPKSSSFTLFNSSLTAQSIAFAASNFGKNNFSGFDFSENQAFTVNDKKGFIKIKLNGNFGHSVYTRHFPLAMVEISKKTTDRDLAGLESDTNFIVNATNKTLKLPDPPYTPNAKSFSLNYQAASTFDLNTANEQTFNNREEQFFHLHPFGQREVHPYLEGSSDVALLPQIGHEGLLFIGLANIKPRQTVSVLFQVAEGSANPLKKRQTVEWHYLYGDHWHVFDPADEANVTDGTSDLLQSGIVTFQLPRRIDSENTWLEKGYTWIRGGVKLAVDGGTKVLSDAVCNLVSVKAQAAKIRFKDNGNAPGFLDEPLAAGTVSKLVRSESSIKKIEQPFTAFGNRPKESPEQFYQRISERLRHKDRAITIWDYEHLVLEAFPHIYKAKCLNHTRLMPKSKDSDVQVDNEFAPGYVLVVTLPDLKNRNAVNPLLPFTSLGTLEQIKAFLAKRISPHVQLDVVNPRFEQVQMEFQVAYHEGFPASIYDRILAADITRFLSPWAYEMDAGQSLDFGGGLHKSVVLDFVEEREYVDFVVQFKMHLRGLDGTDQEDIEAAVATTARSVLVSHPKHLINLKPVEC